MDRTSLPTPSAQPPVGVDRGLPTGGCARRALCEELVLDDPLPPRPFTAGRVTRLLRKNVYRTP